MCGRIHCVILLNASCSADLLIQKYPRKSRRYLRILYDVDLLIEFWLLLLQEFGQIALLELSELLEQLQLIHLMLLL